MEDTTDISLLISRGLTRFWVNEISKGIGEIPFDNPDYVDMDRIWCVFIKLLGHRNSKFIASETAILEIQKVTFNMLAFLDMTLRRAEKKLEDTDNPQYGPELREIELIKKQLENVVIDW
jgi:hypothetical protein